ncbi:T3SS effector NleG family protein [Salmonella enterica subsp. enterica serovar Carrau]|uniref:T3SS effector NleG family protein n=1 Tax=Salmonella enterica TaxID=28901 RepID=UPI00159279B9|nr:T3SS effector NleG family protein [Salmonella enterica]EHO4505763.1 T3SS effector NleG family protein [Salmonella enterica subsp. enterica serovar Carrau]EJD9019093.1 T3SS effector NleG family protein [Salmonella enterica subsp. enterica serovar Newport]EFO5311524.1 DUF1076 domain-containing protein [Salmonella enterica]EFO8057639.1 DUF1076 domain-containing protein [Salmonella enterica]EGH9944026.1 DUF1076 domain-containing protein [Salmonella enterica]
MPLSFPNVYLNTRGRIETLPSDILDSIRNASRPPDGVTGPTEIQVQLRDALYQVRHSPDEGTFEVVPWREPGQVYGDIRRNYPERFSNAERLASQLNCTWNMPAPPTFLTFAEHQDARYRFNTQPANINHSLPARINLCSFQVEAGSFACSEEHLTCPITLDIPTEGVFVKVSSQSDVCCLFDKEAFLNLVRQELKHPLSRESICMGMIVRKSECFFNTERDKFTLIVSD